jgi:K+-transporting ATPase c subunit
MTATVRPALGVSIIFFILLGLAYPLAETGIGQAFFNHQANGSLTADGSTQVGQAWTGPRWFHGRPDADNPMATGGANLGPAPPGPYASAQARSTGACWPVPGGNSTCSSSGAPRSPG